MWQLIFWNRAPYIQMFNCGQSTGKDDKTSFGEFPTEGPLLDFIRGKIYYVDSATDAARQLAQLSTLFGAGNKNKKRAMNLGLARNQNCFGKTII